MTSYDRLKLCNIFQQVDQVISFILSPYWCNLAQWFMRYEAFCEGMSKSLGFPLTMHAKSNIQLIPHVQSAYYFPLGCWQGAKFCIGSWGTDYTQLFVMLIILYWIIYFWPRLLTFGTYVWLILISYDKSWTALLMRNSITLTSPHKTAHIS